MKIIIRIIAILGVLVSTIMMFISFTSDESLHTAFYVFENLLIDEKLDGFKIVQLSDFHNHSLNYSNGYLPKLIKDEDPDIIVLTGDFVDQFTHKHNLSNLEMLFNELSDYPIYYVPGNHEAYAANAEDFFDLLDSFSNIHNLTDKNEKIMFNGSSFNLSGIHDPYLKGVNKLDNDNENMRVMEPTVKALRDKLDDKLSILLAHRPGMMDLYAKYNFDLVFSGHTHGGQINLLPVFKYQSGEYKKDNTTLIVSNGIGSNGKFPIRFNSPMQLVSLTFKVR